MMFRSVSPARARLTRSLLPVLSGALIAVSSPVFADTIDVLAAIDRVTVYPRGAQVTRAAEVTVPAGSHTLRIANLPDGILAETVRVEGSSTGTLEIGAVDLKRVELTREEAERAAEARRELEDRIKALETELEKIGYDLRVKETQRDFLTNLAGLPNRGVPASQAGGGSPDWAAIYQLIGTNMSSVQTDIFTLRQSLQETERRIEDARRELSRLAPKPSDRLVGDVTVVGDTEQTANLVIRYQVRAASWRPLYEARLDTGDNQTAASLSLTRRAAIQQSSGESWENVELTLSTVRPSGRTAAPDVNSLFVDFARPPVAASLATGRAMAEDADRRAKLEPPVNERRLRSSRQLSAMQAPAKPNAIRESGAAITSGRFQAAFAVPDRVTVANDGTVKQVRIDSQSVEPKLVVRTSPRLVKQAFLYAVYKLPGTSPFLRGTMTLFRDGTYVGRGRMPEKAGGEEHELGFGADDRVKVTFAVADDTRANQSGIISSSRVETKSFKTTITNMHDRRIDVYVSDRVPVSREEDIEIEVVSKPKPSETNIKDRRGVHAWSFPLDAGKEQVIETRYKVTWPADKKIEYRG